MSPRGPVLFQSFMWESNLAASEVVEMPAEWGSKKGFLMPSLGYSIGLKICPRWFIILLSKKLYVNLQLLSLLKSSSTHLCSGDHDI
jgi:hypothetical protein